MGYLDTQIVITNTILELFQEKVSDKQKQSSRGAYFGDQALKAN